VQKDWGVELRKSWMIPWEVLDQRSLIRRVPLWAIPARPYSPSPGGAQDEHSFSTKAEIGAGDVAQCLPSMHEALTQSQDGCVNILGSGKTQGRGKFTPCVYPCVCPPHKPLCGIVPS
jgi:hypothetical protein